MADLDNLLRLGSMVVRGPSPSFDRPHLLLAFLTIGDRGSIGRHALAKSTGVGEGAIRTILKKLRDGGYVDSKTSGARLTDKGGRLHTSVRKILSQFTLLKGSLLTLGRSQVAIDIRGRASSVKSGIEQRDAAIRIGATGATTYAFLAGKFTVPGESTDCEKDYPSDAWPDLRRELSPRNGDAVVLCGADDETAAKLGALSSAMTLL